MPHEDQREFYTCPICGITTGNDIDGNEKHDCPEEEDYIKINLSLLTNKPMKESTVPIDEKWKEELQTILLNLSCDRSSDTETLKLNPPKTERSNRRRRRADEDNDRDSRRGCK